MLYLHNSLSKTKELFKPIRDGHIGMYTCGVTVYDRCHLGHARSMVAFDVMVRFFRASGYKVNLVRNITDIDDKIINRARERDCRIDELTTEYIKVMHDDMRALSITPADKEPRATDFIDEIQVLISRLLMEDVAYVSENGDVCFDVHRFKDYGKLSHKKLDTLISGARIEVVNEKRSPLDFVLWKRAKAGEPSWQSPWGDGRPGWHIECSAMAIAELGEQFDIHGGGVDLQFPHHENEIAQSEAATHKPFANYWLHVGMLQINNEKMAKSTGNFLTIEDVLQAHHAETVRYFLISAHYRSPLNYSEDSLNQAHRALLRLYQALEPYSKLWGQTELKLDTGQDAVKAFFDAMNDDINTPLALSVLFDLANQLNKTKDEALAVRLLQLGRILGLFQVSPKDFMQGQKDESNVEIERLVAERNQARAEKNWTAADALRQKLADMGVEILDSAEGTRWRFTK